MTRRFVTEWWSLDLPIGWSVVRDDVCWTFSANPPNGAVQISSAQNERGMVSDVDLCEFASRPTEAGARLERIVLGDFVGLYTHYSHGGRYWREWYLRAGDRVLYVTYNRDDAAPNSEDPMVDGMLRTLRIER